MEQENPKEDLVLWGPGAERQGPDTRGTASVLPRATHPSAGCGGEFSLVAFARPGRAGRERRSHQPHLPSPRSRACKPWPPGRPPDCSEAQAAQRARAGAQPPPPRAPQVAGSPALIWPRAGGPGLGLRPTPLLRLPARFCKAPGPAVAPTKLHPGGSRIHARPLRRACSGPQRGHQHRCAALPRA